jgi:glycosyltransferase involved in cell wall biosynthesis
MKISVLIIAHNESDHIGECIESILAQSCIPDEIICIVHNSTDETVSIARKYPQVQVMEFCSKETWPLYARIYWFNQVHWDIIACIDGDSVASIYWLRNIIEPLKSNASIVATWGFVYLIDNLVGQWIARIFFLSGLPLLRTIFHFYFWGANFACKKEAYIQCGGLQPLVKIQKEIGLHYSAEDCYLAFALSTIGHVWFVSNARVSTYPWSFYKNDISRWMHQRSDRKKLLHFFHKYPQI